MFIRTLKKNELFINRAAQDEVYSSPFIVLKNLVVTFHAIIKLINTVKIKLSEPKTVTKSVVNIILCFLSKGLTQILNSFGKKRNDNLSQMIETSEKAWLNLVTCHVERSVTPISKRALNSAMDLSLALKMTEIPKDKKNELFRGESAQVGYLFLKRVSQYLLSCSRSSFLALSSASQYFCNVIMVKTQQAVPANQSNPMNVIVMTLNKMNNINITKNAAGVKP